LGLTSEKYRVLVVLRSDGTSLYATTDLPLAVRKFDEYKLDRSVYVVDVRQSLYLSQLFKTLEIMGHDFAPRCHHLAYEIVNLPGNVTMSSRDGTIVLLEDLISEATTRAIEVVRQKDPSLAEAQMQEIGRAVAMGAIKYSMLNRDNTRVVTFDWESALDFEGQAAPYIQYAHVRANSILRKAGESGSDKPVFRYPLETPEIILVDTLSRFPAEVQKAAEEMKPVQIANYCYKLAQAFNDFYNQCPVLQAPREQRAGRLHLVRASKQVLSNALALLGITAPEVM
jgi:arginyl-tRNA synthetase